MIDRRQEERVRIELKVKVSGVDARCEGFSEHAIATNISRSGALLSRITTDLRCGDLLVIEYGSRRAHYRIFWVLDSGTGVGSRVAVHRVGHRPCSWEELLPVTEAVGD
jgi:hypothetical protein